MDRITPEQVLSSMRCPINSDLQRRIWEQFENYPLRVFQTDSGLIVKIDNSNYHIGNISLFSLQTFMEEQKELNNLIPNSTIIAVVIKSFTSTSQVRISLTDDVQQVIIDRQRIENRERPSNYLKFEYGDNNPYYETHGGSLYEKLGDGSLALLNYFDNVRHGNYRYGQQVEREPINNRTSVINPYAFAGCQLSDLTLLESVTRLLPRSLAGCGLEGKLVCKGPVTEFDFTGFNPGDRHNLVIFINNSRDRLTPKTEELVKLCKNTRVEFVFLAPTLLTKPLSHGMLQLTHAELNNSYCNLRSPVDFHHLTYRQDPIIADASFIAYFHSVDLECYDGIHEGTAIMFLGKTPLQKDPNPEYTYDTVLVWEDPKTVQELVLKAKLEK